MWTEPSQPDNTAGTGLRNWSSWRHMHTHTGPAGQAINHCPVVWDYISCLVAAGRLQLQSYFWQLELEEVEEEEGEGEGEEGEGKGEERAPEERRRDEITLRSTEDIGLHGDCISNVCLFSVLLSPNSQGHFSTSTRLTCQQAEVPLLSISLMPRHEIPSYSWLATRRKGHIELSSLQGETTALRSCMPASVSHKLLHMKQEISGSIFTTFNRSDSINSFCLHRHTHTFTGHDLPLS